MIALGFLDVEANILDPFGKIEFQHLLGRIHAVLGKHGDHVEWYVFAKQKANAGDGSIKRAATRARHAMGIVEAPGSVDADPQTNVPLLQKIAPLRRDQHAIRLNGVPKFKRGRAQGLDGLKCRLIESDGQNQRLSRMPDNRQLRTRPSRSEDFLEECGNGALLYYRLVI